MRSPWALSSQISLPTYCWIGPLFWGAMTHLFICLQSFCPLSSSTNLFCIDTSRFLCSLPSDLVCRPVSFVLLHPLATSLTNLFILYLHSNTCILCLPFMPS